MMLEIRDIPGFPGYAAREDGAILSCRAMNGSGELLDKWRVLRGAVLKNRGGYINHSIMRNCVRFTARAHHLVLWAFAGERPPGTECCHNDGNPQNNHISNLRWDTQLNNHADKGTHGTKMIGEKNPARKLDCQKVAEIRRRHNSGESSYRLAKEFGVSSPSVLAIVHRKTWKHVA